MNILISIALLGTTSPSMDLPQSFVELVSQQIRSTDFQLGRAWSKGTVESGFSTYGRGRRQSDRAGIAVDLGRSRSTAAAERHWQAMAPSLIYSKPYAPFSELPLGMSTRRHLGAGSTIVETYDGFINVKVLITYRGTGPRGQVTWHITDREADKIATEGMARKLLASASGMSASLTSPTQVGGTNVSTILGTRGERLVDLLHYCQVLGIALQTNTLLGTASFTAGGEQVIIPLAAKKIKDGSRWINTTDISVIKDGKWYVSYAALQDARGQ